MKMIITTIFFAFIFSITTCFGMQQEPVYAETSFKLISESLQEKDYDSFIPNSSFEIIFFTLDCKPYAVLSSLVVKNFKTKRESIRYYEFSLDALKNKFFDLTHWFYHAIKNNATLKKQIKENLTLNMQAGALMQRNEQNLFAYQNSHIFIDLTHKVKNEIQEIKKMMHHYLMNKNDMIQYIFKIASKI